jgi:serine protease AprX
MGNLEKITKLPKVNKITATILGSILTFTAAAWGVTTYSSGDEYILQGASRPALVSAIQAENGVIIHEFKLIQAVSAKLTDKQVQGIASRNAMIRFFNEDNQVSLSANNSMALMQGNLLPQNAPRNSPIPSQIGASELHEIGVTGEGVAVAIIDSGLGQFSALNQNTSGLERRITVVNSLGEDASGTPDLNGHGSHMASILADSTNVFDQYGAPTGARSGVAPDVDLVMIKAFDDKGEASYSSVLQGIEYAIENRDRLNIRVLNVAFSFPATSFYWEDPINQALMRAWDNGITVIAPAGNGGNKNMTVGVPGNNPYVITVGAMDDNRTPVDTSDDIVASFSSFGPTVEGFMKPELLAPGTNVRGFVSQNSLLAEENGTSGISGTSQATAVAAGVVALMIQQDPSLTPDEIKCRLMSSASQAKKQNGELAFSLFAQGAGLINAPAAINSTAVGCANSGLNIANDINLRSHYFGPARFNEKTNEFVLGDDEQANGVIWQKDVTAKSDNRATNGVIWQKDVLAKSDDRAVNGVIWQKDVAAKSDNRATNGVIWQKDVVAKSDDRAANGVIWQKDVVANFDDRAVNGVIWQKDVVAKSDNRAANGVIWQKDVLAKSDDRAVNGVIWQKDVAAKSDNRATNGVIWQKDVVAKSDDRAANGVIWQKDVVAKSDDRAVNGVIWQKDVAVKSDNRATYGVIWQKDVVAKSDDRAANGVIWQKDVLANFDDSAANGVIWQKDVVAKSDDSAANGVIWQKDVVAKSDDRAANGVIWQKDVVANFDDRAVNGVIWQKDVVAKSDDRAINGVIWQKDVVANYDDRAVNGVIWQKDVVAKSDDRAANGVIWQKDVAAKSDNRAANGVIWQKDVVAKSDDKEAQGIIWSVVKEISYAQAAVAEAGVSETSPQMKLIEKWSVRNNPKLFLSSNNVIRLKSSNE